MSEGFYGKKIAIHACAWIIYILYELSILIYINPNDIIWTEILLAFSLNISVFYLTSEFILPYGTRNKAPSFIALSLLIIIGTYLLCSYMESRYLFPFIEGKKSTMPNTPAFIKLYIAQHVYRIIYFIGLSSGYWFAKKSILTERRLRKVEGEQFLQQLHEKELVKDLAVSQIGFFRSQINPHFLFNTLNFFYSNIYPFSKPLAKALLLLSDIMRYTIKQNDTEGKASLTDEIKYINDYIELNQLRFDNSLHLKFEIKGVPEHKMIAVFVMMTLIENAFKYGDMTDINYPTLIRLNIMADKLEFYIENKIKRSKKPIGEGIGLQNLKNRLDLIYKNNYTFSINEDDQKFYCLLKINTLR